MKKCVFLLLTIGCVLAVQAQTATECIRQRLDSIIGHAAMLQTSQLGLLVYDLDADSILYAYNHRQTMRPASTMKLVTAITAIDRLGGDYQLRTSLYYNGVVASHVLAGDLVCVGGMDPAFSADDLALFAESVRQLGIDTIQGTIRADLSFKDADLLGEGWCWDDDNPKLSPLLVGKKDNFVERLAQTLRGLGVVLKDSTLAHVAPTRTLVCQRTHTLDEVLGPMLKDSNNLFAESVYYQLAAAGGNRPARASHARQYEQQLMQRVGLNPASYRLADGSGLSLYNYVSAELLVRLLRYGWQNEQVASHLLPALPIAGVDGTLKSRMTGRYTLGNVRAKTGTLTGISSLAGYCTVDSVRHLCFAIMNQGVLRNADGKAFQDVVCQALCTPAGVSMAVAAKPRQTVVRKSAVTRPSARKVKGGKANKKKSRKKKR